MLLIDPVSEVCVCVCIPTQPSPFPLVASTCVPLLLSAATAWGLNKDFHSGKLAKKKTKKAPLHQSELVKI